MRPLLALLALLSTFNLSMAQERHFLYLQADNEQPFYVKMDGDTRSSTTSGYIILPRLKDSTLDFVVGFPMRKFPEYRFHLVGLSRDRGLALKDFGEKGWGLFDLQTMDVNMGQSLTLEGPVTRQRSITAVSDSFASVLASVTADSTLMDAAMIVQKSDVAKTVPSIPVQASDSATGVLGTALQQAPPRKQVAGSADSMASPVMPVVKSVEVPKVQSGDSTGAGKTAGTKPAGPKQDMPKADSSKSAGLVQTSGQLPSAHIPIQKSADTPIAVPIPSTDHALPAVQSPIKAAQQKTTITQTQKLLEFSDSTGWQIVFSDRDDLGRYDTVSIWIPAAPRPTASALGPKPESNQKQDPVRQVRADCSGTVSASDLGLLRRRMESIPDEDAKVAVALKEFRLRCFTSEQVRSLLVVFFREEGRYKMLDAAYSRVYDPQEFLSLQSVLKDPYFIHRFRKLVGLQ